MTGLPTITASKISSGLIRASAAHWPTSAFSASRTARVISRAPPGLSIA